MSQPVRITYVIPTLDQSGAERQLTLLATNLPAEKYSINVIALNRGGYYARQLQEAGVQVDVLEKRFRFDPLTFVRLRRLLRKTRPEIIQSFLFSANSYVRLPGVCPSGARVIVSERCVDSWKSGWQLATDRKLSSRMDVMTANSTSVADFYINTVGISPERIVVIPNGVPVPVFNSLDTHPSVREELGLPSDAKLVGFAGRLAPQKCLSDLMWAFQLLHQVVENVYLVLIGDGPERDQLTDLAHSFECREKVFFLGHRQDAQQVLSQLNAFCLTSSFEGMSNSLMEAMAFGIPAVVSDIPANRELVHDQVNGLVVPPGQGPGITKALKRVLTDSTLAATLGENAKRFVRDNHSVDQLVDRHQQLYERLLNKSVTS